MDNNNNGDTKEEKPAEDLPDLLFFDTFAHETSERINLDYIQFTSPIYIHQIHVIPLGSKIEADLPGRVRLGATNPSAISLKFYVNDLTKPSLTTFSDFGSLEYKQNVVNDYFPVDKKPTDGLLIKGSYRTLTVAIFGEATDITSIDAQSSDTPCSTPLPESSGIHLSDEILKSSSTLPVISDLNEGLLAVDETVKEEFTSSSRLPVSSVFEDDKVVSSTISSHPHSLEEEPIVSCSTPAAARQSNGSENSMENAKHSKSNQVDKLRDIVKPHRRSPLLYSSSTRSSSYSRRKRSRSKSPTGGPRSKRSHRSSRSPNYYRKDSDVSPLDHRTRSPVSRRISRSPKSRRSRSPRSVRSRSPRSFRSSSRSPTRRGGYRALPASPITTYSPSPRSLLSTRSASPRSHSPLTLPPVRVSEGRDLLSKEREKTLEEGKANSTTSPVVKESKAILPVDTDLLEPISPDHSPPVVENVSEEEFPDLPNGDTEKEIEEFEAISSDEEYIDESCPVEDSEMLVDYADYQLNDYSYIWTFDPFHCQFSALKYFPDACMTSVEKEKHLSRSPVDEEKRNELLSMMKEFEEYAPKHDKWIEAVEKVASDISHLSFSDPKIVNLLVSSVKTGLDYELAIKQPQLGYKVRHLKTGIKLLIALLNASSSFVEPLLAANVTQSLLNLYSEQYMSLPIKLLIIRGLDAIVDFAEGMEHFISETYRFKKDNSEETCYQVVVKLVLENKPSRLAYALMNLLNKVHLFESCKLLKSHLRSFKEGQSVDIEKLKQLISTIASFFRKAKHVLVQRQRFLPARAHFQVNEVVNTDVYASLYRWFKQTDLLGSLTYIYKIQDLEEVTEQCDELISELIAEESSASFFLSKEMVGQTNELQSLLVQSCDETEGQPQIGIGLRLSYTLQANYLIDSLFHSAKQTDFDLSKSFDDPEITSTLHRLYTLVFSTGGRAALVDVLTTGNNLSVLYPFLQTTGVKKLDLKMSKSVCAGYATELCLLAVTSCDDRILSFLQTHGSFLLKIADNSFLPKLEVLSSWLSVLKNCVKFSYCEQTFKTLVDILKKYCGTESIKGEVPNCTAAFLIPYEAITALRILKHLCVNTRTVSQSSYDTSVELKHQYGILQYYTLEGYGATLSILTKLTDTYLKPSHQSPALVGTQGSVVVFLLKPALELIKETLQYLTKARGKDFKDVSAIPLFLRIYSLMAIFPRSSAFYSTSQSIRAQIVDILTIYTQLLVGAAETEEAFIKSVWAKMINEIFQYMFSSPSVFIHGLSVLSDMLPLPLPVYSSTPLDEEEVGKIVNVRKVWSAHLHALHGEIEKMIGNFVYSSSNYLQQMLRRVCVQISDLSAPSAAIIAKTVLDIVAEHLVSPEDLSSYEFHCVLSLLTCLAGYPAFKTALIQIMYGVKKEETHVQVLPKLLSLLKLTTESGGGGGVGVIAMNVKELLMSFIHSLCDFRLSLNSDTNTSNLQNLSNSIPPKDALSLIVNALISILIVPLNRDNNVSIVCFALRTLSLICEHDFGYWIVKGFLIEKHSSAMHALFSNISSALENEKLSMSDDVISAIESTLYLIKMLLNNGENHQILPFRQIKCTVNDMKKILNWEALPSTVTRDDSVPKAQGIESPDSSSKAARDVHPILMVKACLNLLQQKEKDESFYSMEKSLEWLCSTFQSQELINQNQLPLVPQQEPLLPSSESLIAQFGSRQVFTLANVKSTDERHHHHLKYLYSLPTLFDNEQPIMSKTLKINLISLGEKYCGPDFHIRTALEELCKCQEPGELPLNVAGSDSTTNSTKRHCEPLITPKENIPGMKSPFIAPMRGRGFARSGGMGHSSRLNDPFRSRPPNTSRPPSMHVDDFVALEQGRGGGGGSGGDMNNFSQNSLKRSSKDYSKRSSPPNSRSFGSTSSPSVTHRSSSSGYYLDPPNYNPRRPYNTTSPSSSQIHSSASARSNRYSRDSYSPPSASSGRSRSGSTGPAANANSSSHWSKSSSGLSSGARRDSRESRDVRMSRQFPR